jgi:hypothetical protein
MGLPRLTVFEAGLSKLTGAYNVIEQLRVSK